MNLMVASEQLTSGLRKHILVGTLHSCLIQRPCGLHIVMLASPIRHRETAGVDQFLSSKVGDCRGIFLLTVREKFLTLIVAQVFLLFTQSPVRIPVNMSGIISVA